ncbi:MAG: flagellar brake protein [Desulfovibrionaceae bacterium]
MDVSIGVNVLMESMGAADRVKCVLQGYSRDEYLILRLPLTAGIRARVPDGALLTFRYLNRGKLISFRANVMRYLAVPFSLLFVTYPKRFEAHDLRSEERLFCHFPATLRRGQKVFHGLMLDLSHGGCRFFPDVEQNRAPFNLRISDVVKGEFRLPNGSPLEFRGKITALEGHPPHTVGLRFPQGDSPLSGELLTYMDEVHNLRERMFERGGVG